MKVSFTVYGAPQGKGRPRFTRSGHVYTPQATIEYENRIIKSYLTKYQRLLFGETDSLSVEIDAVFEPPSSYSQVRKARMLNGEYPTKKPDIDNICKVYMDAMNGIVYPDDKQVIAVVMQKRYGEVAEVNVTVERIEDGEEQLPVHDTV